MRPSLLFILLVLFVGYQVFMTFTKEHKFLEFARKYNDKSWMPAVLLRTGNFWFGIQEYKRAKPIFEECMKDDFKLAQERPDCFYGLARTQDKMKRFDSAKQNYEIFIGSFPAHAKTGKAKERFRVLNER
ncbi:tol-pal system YbgF family protein [Elusimicrobiota bacterium]